jgi:hypothetical protein
MIDQLEQVDVIYTPRDKYDSMHAMPFWNRKTFRVRYKAVVNMLFRYIDPVYLVAAAGRAVGMRRQPDDIQMVKLEESILRPPRQRPRPMAPISINDRQMALRVMLTSVKA